jgi:hypothetical protein
MKFLECKKTNAKISYAKISMQKIQIQPIFTPKTHTSYQQTKPINTCYIIQKVNSYLHMSCTFFRQNVCAQRTLHKPGIYLRTWILSTDTTTSMFAVYIPLLSNPCPDSSRCSVVHQYPGVRASFCGRIVVISRAFVT